MVVWLGDTMTLPVGNGADAAQLAKRVIDLVEDLTLFSSDRSSSNELYGSRHVVATIAVNDVLHTLNAFICLSLLCVQYYQYLQSRSIIFSATSVSPYDHQILILNPNEMNYWICSWKCFMLVLFFKIKMIPDLNSIDVGWSTLLSHTRKM